MAKIESWKLNIKKYSGGGGGAWRAILCCASTAGPTWNFLNRDRLQWLGAPGFVNENPATVAMNSRHLIFNKKDKLHFVSQLIKLFFCWTLHRSLSCIRLYITHGSICFRILHNCISNTCWRSKMDQTPADVEKWPLSFWTYIRKNYIEPR